MKINCITIAQNIQRLMDQKGIDRNKLCKDLGLKYATVSSWLEATKYPRMDKIDMLAEYFEVPRVYLTEQWYTQTQGVPHLFDSAPIYIIDNGKKVIIQKSAPTDDGRSKKIEKILNDIALLDDAGLDLLGNILSNLVVALKSKSNREE